MTDICHVTPYNKEVIIEPSEQVTSIMLHVTGMGCPNCANRVHNRLIDHPGVVKAEIDHETGIAVIIYLPDKVSVAHLVGLVGEAGDQRHTYSAVLSGQEDDHESTNDGTPFVQARHALE